MTFAELQFHREISLKMIVLMQLHALSSYLLLCFSSTLLNLFLHPPL